ELDGRVALVTGGGTGLGAAVCRALGAAGAAVGVNYSRSARDAEAVAASLPRAIAVQADVRDEEQVAAMVAAVERDLGPIDLLVNDAGVTVYVPFEDLDGVTREDWESILGVNVVGAWHCARAVAAGMRARGDGAIVNVASDSAFTLDGSSIPYVVSKAAIVALTHALARALAPTVRVNAVAPGWMDTPWLDRYVPDELVAELRSGAEPVVGLEVVTSEILRLLRDEQATGEVTVLTPPEG
ncbi:MAG: SDR family NAD(P)-dependent oxidoreductase, partial [Actinomycetota bacterium]